MKVDVVQSTTKGCVRIEMYYAKPYEFDMRIEPGGLHAIGEDEGFLESKIIGVDVL